MQRAFRLGLGVRAAALAAALIGFAFAARADERERQVADLVNAAAEELRIADGLRANVARKRDIDARNAAVEADNKAHNLKIAEEKQFCSGSHFQTEYNQRKGICDGLEREGAARLRDIAARRSALDAEDAARLNDAASLRAAYQANQQRVKATVDALVRDATLSAMWAPCAGLPNLPARSKCLDDAWASAAAAAAKGEQDEFDRMNAAWLARQEAQVRAAAASDARWRKAILDAIDKATVPSPYIGPATLADAKPGDVLLLVPEQGFSPTRLIPPADWIYRVAEHWRSGETFREAIQTPTAPVSHAVTMVKAVNGQMLFLDHTHLGMKILTKADFEAKYSHRGMYVARPTTPVDGRALWDAASRAARFTSTTGKSGYGVGCDRKVCSTTAGLLVAQSTGVSLDNHRFGPIDVTPGDFFDNEASGKYFVVTPIAH